jgi:hypothetical protein
MKWTVFKTVRLRLPETNRQSGLLRTRGGAKKPLPGPRTESRSITGGCACRVKGDYWVLWAMQSLCHPPAAKAMPGS